MRFSMVSATCAAMLASAIAPAMAEESNSNSAPYSLFGNRLEDLAGIKAFGYLWTGFSKNNTSTREAASGGHSNFPITGPSDEGLQINALQFALERPIKTNILPRITPLPGPTPWEYSFGFRAELLYGRNGLPAQMFGFDSGWEINRSTGAPGTNRQNYLAMPQVYAQMYLPIWQGMALTVGRFGAGVGREIAPAWRPGPNFFYSHSYAFVAQPDQVSGGLLSVNLMRNNWGLLAGEFGVVQGWQNWDDNNKNKAVTGALRWRSSDMSTWIDYSFMRGDGQNDLSVTGTNIQMPISRVIAKSGQTREHHSLAMTLNPTPNWSVTGEILYGAQKGDGQLSTVDVLRGPGFNGGSYTGFIGQVFYKISDTLKSGVRFETFHDRKGVALFPTTAVAGDFNGITFGLNWNANANVVIRPEIRYDWQANNNGVNAYGADPTIPGSATESKQTTFSVDAIIYF